MTFTTTGRKGRAGRVTGGSVGDFAVEAATALPFGTSVAVATCTVKSAVSKVSKKYFDRNILTTPVFIAQLMLTQKLKNLKFAYF
ncbi:hypothetical protein tpqmel_0394 [Candidatus Gastranaerophilus sp. (ex Termes propinquus)]|nr:hypothetical protein tpqmel_0394 [Candidatus Gastranaerophilus sp. (ex Termes propinquus)]